MTSSAVTGDKRWGASARRGGMTVLGKVAVPKPINLPSQRLENHGLDPSVEIVPKGTLSWGSRPSSAGSNAWGTSALSPTTDGSSSSPRHLIGRPSSGGGSRPSTAGSEGAHDTNVSAWGSNSRPSSASGILASNNASSASLRPRSAETRPGSSHLSRFAEPAPEGPGIRGATAAPERIGVASSTKEGFSLTSGDFPTLGSDKEESKRNMEPLDLASYGHPSSSGGLRMAIDSRGTGHGDDFSRNSDVKGNSWKKDNIPCVEDGPRPSMERWHGEPHLYPNHNMGPPHYESWRGAPPVNPSGGVWYRGPPGPPYGGPVPPGGFPMEPFPYYHPQVPAPGLANSQPIPPGVGHHAHHPKNGDMPHMAHVPHLHPGIPMRPGFYPVPYDGYYRPPMGFCNPNERDLPFMGMPPGPPVYARHANQNGPDLINTHPRSRDGRGPDQVEPCHQPDTRGQYKVLASPNDVWNHDEEEKWGHRVTNSASASIHDKGILSKPSLQESAWEDDFKKDEDIHYGKSATIPVSSHSSDNIHASINHSRGRLPERLSNVDDAQINPSMEHSPRDHSLIQKIEGLNAKARATGGKQEDFHREEPNDRVQKVNAKDYRSSNEANSDVILERHYPSGVLVPVSRNIDVSTVDKSQEPAVASATAASRRSNRGAQIKGDPHAKGKFHGQEADGGGKKSDSQFVPEGSSRSTFKDQVQEHNTAVQTAEAPSTNFLGKFDGEPVMSGIDHSDMQRAKMREIAKQRAIQLQKEEEERVKEQKAKALAKLEELNRRSVDQSTENPNQKETIPICGEAPKRQGVSKNLPEASVDLNPSTGPGTGSPNNIAQLKERSSSKIVDSAVASSLVVAESKSSAYQEDSMSSQNQVPPADNYSDDAASHRPAPQVREVSKQKRGGYKQRQNVPSEKTSMQDTIPVGRSDLLKDLKVASSSQEVTGSLVDAGVGKEQVELPVTAEFPHQKKKSNKSGKTRPKVEESPAAISSSVTQPKDFSLSQAVLENSEQSGSGLYDNSSSKSADPKDAIQSENYSSSSREGTHGRGNSSWKAQHSRKPRNPQGNRSAEKTHSNDAVVWAPVRSHNKLEVIDQSSQNTAEHFVSSAPGDNLVHNSSKTKRAEMERYVPKFVAKELAQQGNTQQTSSPSVEPAATDGSIGREKASDGSESVMKAGANVEPKHVDGKNKHPKAQGSFRQRGSAESSSVQASQNSSAASTRLDESFVTLSRPDECSEKGSHANISNGWEIVNDSSSTFTGEKDRIPSGRGKRHPFKGYKGSDSHQNFDQKDSNASLTDQFSHLEANQMEKTASSKENRAAGDRSVSHWQPKPQGYVVHSQQGNRSRGGQNLIIEDRRALKSDTGPIVSSHPQPRRNQSAAKDLISATENKDAGEAIPSTELQEAKQDKRVQPVKGRPHSPRRELEASAGEVEPASLGAVDGRNEQRPSSGYRKNANNSGRFNRGYESRGDWSSTAQENKQHYSSANRERQRQNSHYEYQPVGPYSGNSRQNESVGETESQSGASRFRERGQGNNSRRGRGNFYGKQSGKE